MNKELKTRQVCLFMFAFFPVVKLFMMGSVISGYAREDTWIAVLINLTLDFLSILAIVYCAKKTDKTFFELLQDCFGKVGSKIIIFAYFLFFMMKGILPLNEAKDYMRLTLFVTKPNINNFLPFFAFAFYLCLKRIRVLGRIADLCFSLTLMGFFLIFFLSLDNADFLAMLPIGAQGIKQIGLGSLSSLNWFGESVYILFMLGEFKYEKNSGLKILLSYGGTAFIIILFSLSFYAVFSSIAPMQKFSLTEAVKYDNAINFTGRFDYLGIIFILFSNFFAMTLPMFFACKCLDKVFNFNLKWIPTLITITIQFIIVVFFGNYFYSIENFIINKAGIIFLIFGNILPMLCPLLLKNKKRQEKDKSIHPIKMNEKGVEL